MSGSTAQPDSAVVPEDGAAAEEETPRDAAPVTPPPGDESPWWIQPAWHWGAVVSVAVAALLHTVMAWGARTPSFPFDEIVLLQYAKFLSGNGMTTPPRGAGYFPAWSFIMTPVWWVTEEPQVAYRLAIALGVIVAVLTIWPLARLVSRLGLTVPQSIVVASVVMSLPARTVQTAYVTSEKFLFLMLVLTLLAAVRHWERPTIPRAVVFALLSALLVASHARAAALGIACLIWLVLMAIRSWKSTLVGIAVLAPLGYLAFSTGGLMNQHLGGGFSQGEKIFDNFREARPSIIARVITGQAWEQTVGSLGLFGIGFAVLLVLVWRELTRERAIGPACLLAAMLLGVVILSVGQWSREYTLYLAEWRRLDAWLYGRYIDPVTSVVAALALAMIVRGLHRAVAAVALAGTVGVAALAVLWIAPDAPTWGYVTPAHIAGITPWAQLLPDATLETWPWGLTPSLTNENSFWLWASIPAVLLVLVLTITGRLRRRGAVIVSAVMLVASSTATVSATSATDEFQAIEGGRPLLADEINRLQAEHDGSLVVEFDRSCSPGTSNNAVVQNILAYWIHPTTMTVTKDRNTTSADISLGCDIWPEGSERGARMLSGLHSYGYHIWVMPGPLQDELAEQGRLEPVADVVPVT